MTDQEQPDAEPSRRRFFKYGAAAAATTAAAAVASAAPVSAADGNSLLIGANNTGTAVTKLTGSQVRVVNGTSGISIYGESVGSVANTAAIGVKGTSGTGGTGVYGEGGTSSIRGVGVRGVSAIGTPLKLDEGSAAFPPTSGTWDAGSFGVDGGHLFYCYGGGTGTGSKWARLSAAPVPLTSDFRVYDSRAGKAPLGVAKGTLGSGATRDISIATNGNVPSDASLVMGNLTVTETVGTGYLSLYPTGVAWPGNSNINWTGSGATLANSFVVKPGTAGKITVKTPAWGGKCHFIIDLVAYFT